MFKKEIICPACQSSNIISLEAISTPELASYWSRELKDAGQLLLQYLESSKVPNTIEIYSCKFCQLEFANPSFEADAEWYSKIEKYLIRWEFSQCLRDLPFQPTQILEIGCGEGYFLEMASRAGHSIVGIDFNESAIKTAKKKRLKAYKCDIKQLKHIENKKFQSLVFFHVIEHLEDLKAFFEDINEMMPVGSTLHFSCPGPRRYTTVLEPEKRIGLRDMWDYPPLHQTRWNQKAANQILSRFGWDLQKYIEEPFNWLGVSSYLVAKDLQARGLDFKSVSYFQRKLLILAKMSQLFIPSIKYKGMSMYCMAIRR